MTIGGVRCTAADFSENFIKYTVPDKDEVTMGNNGNALVMVIINYHKVNTIIIN